MTEQDQEAIFDGHRDRYLDILVPLFLPEDPLSHDIVRYFSSLLRVLGMEDCGWDPYSESRKTLDDLNRLIKIESKRETTDPLTVWRLGLILYAHIVEMDAPYEVITNLLRFRLNKGYSPNPFFDFLTEKEQNNFAKRGIRTGRKIEIIKELSAQAQLNAGAIFDDFYNNRLRNAIQHSDFILTDEEFRSRSGIKAFKFAYNELDALITQAKAFIAAFFDIEATARKIWGSKKGKAIPYDPHYKGLMEILVDDQDLMCGFAVHWPNNSQSTYRRSEQGIEMTNCTLDLKNSTINLWVDLYARNPGTFSPLVERDGKPLYTPIDGSTVRPTWPDNL